MIAQLIEFHANFRPHPDGAHDLAEARSGRHVIEMTPLRHDSAFATRATGRHWQDLQQKMADDAGRQMTDGIRRQCAMGHALAQGIQAFWTEALSGWMKQVGDHFIQAGEMTQAIMPHAQSVPLVTGHSDDGHVVEVDFEHGPQHDAAVRELHQKFAH